MTMPEQLELIAAAKAIATIAHRGQFDKAGEPYIGHPERVVGLLPRDSSARLIAAAWLHDVLEDTDLTREDLFAAGIDWSTINIVEALTRDTDFPIEDYYDRIRLDHSARTVKIADIADNSDVNRLASLDDPTIARLTRKYAKARKLIGAAA